MSKSAPDPRSRVLLTDSSAEIARKLKSAATDSEASISFDPSARPGTSNLLSILAACEGGEASPQQIAERYTSKGHAALKQDVADAVVALLEGPRREFERIKNEAGYVEQVQREGAARARELSSKTLALVRERLGLA
jgi:tryptophanyl-tRNA synthetase